MTLLGCLPLKNRYWASISGLITMDSREDYCSQGNCLKTGRSKDYSFEGWLLEDWLLEEVLTVGC